MDFKTLPTDYQDTLKLDKAFYQPYVDDLLARELTAESLDQWMLDWTSLADVAEEQYSRLAVMNTQDTTDEEIEALYTKFLEEVLPYFSSVEQQLKEKLLETGLNPKNFDVQMRAMRQQAAIFREENLPLLSEERKLDMEYDKVAGSQVVEWDGEEITISRLLPVLFEQDRNRREQSWKLYMGEWLKNREQYNETWGKYMDLRLQIAENADFDNFRDYAYVRLGRFDYGEEECKAFNKAIEEVVVPACERLYNRQREKLGQDTLRPWDLEVDPLNRPTLKPFKDVDELISTCSTIFKGMDSELFAYYNRMDTEGLLDLDNRKGKAPGGYCASFPLTGVPFIFMNAVGLHDDVQTLLHESGHAFHDFESGKLPYSQQRQYGFEVAEIASMAMELLTAESLTKDKGGFYTTAQAAQARIQHLESALRFWPYMSVVDGFQHWVYENPEAAKVPANCDAAWGDLWDRYMVGIDYSGFEDIKVTGWHRKLHIHQVPFYYVDYGLAQLAAVQIWGNSLEDHAKALKQYRSFLSLGGTRTVPELFEASGAKFQFDTATLGKAVELMENTILELEQVG